MISTEQCRGVNAPELARLNRNEIPGQPEVGVVSAQRRIMSAVHIHVAGLPETSEAAV